MQVDNMARNGWDIADILHSDLFTANPSSSMSASSRESTPHLPTPPQQPPYPSFPVSSSSSTSMDPSSESFFAFLDSGDERKPADPFEMNDYAFDFSNIPMMMTSPMPTNDATQLDVLMSMGGVGAMEMGIDPQLVDSPTPVVEDPEEPPKTTLTIAPIKVGGRGGGRRGTVQSGGISKKSAAAPNGALGLGNVAVYDGSVLKEDKENVPKARGRGRKAAEALPSPPNSHHDGEEEAEEEHQPAPAPPPPPPSGGSVLTGNALVAHGRKVTPFDLGIEGLSLSASFAIPPGTFNVTTPSAVGSSSGLGVGALIGANNSGAFAKAHNAREASVEADGDGDEIPADWRPSPEALAKMSSKEKRQLRNKISARNFRVRRKEYISTLELDIAERDRLLDAIRTELGTSRNENVALRQEIETLKRTLLDGRGAAPVDGFNLPPPAPLPDRSAAEVIAAQQQQQASVSSANLLKPNTQKDRGNNGVFWGGVGGLGGVLPVHTAFVPSVASGFASMGVAGMTGLGVLQENMNPMMRGRRPEEEREKKEKENFDGFADANMFTMKSMDAYRMHLWGKMAEQYHLHQQQSAMGHHHHHQQQQQQQQQQYQQQQAYQRQHQAPLSGLAANMRPSYFTGVSAAALSGKASATESTRPPLGNTTNTHTPLLSAFLSGKQMSLFGKQAGVHHYQAKQEGEKEKEKEKQNTQERQEQQARAAVLAAVASQTILKKMGQAFWDAFSGSSSNSNSWDADKVRKVLEGSAVVRIVDVDPPVKVEQQNSTEKSMGNVNVKGSVSAPSSPIVGANVSTDKKACRGGAIGRALTARGGPQQQPQPQVLSEKGMCDVLEDRMSRLALGGSATSLSRRE